MKERKKCVRRKSETSTQENLKTDTMVTPDDFGKMPKEMDGGKVSDEWVEESAVMINPDAESMESRG